MESDLPRDSARRAERARADFVKGVVRPDAPGMVYYPSLPELAVTYDLIPSNLERISKDDGWLDARREAMTYSAIVPFSAAVDGAPALVKRAEMVALEMETFDDRVFRIADRAMALADKAIAALEDEDDPVRTIRALRSISQTVESFHRTAKTAYDPTSVRPENTVNINVSSIQASEDVVGKVAAIYAKMEQDALARGISQAEIDSDVIEGDVVDE